MKRYGGRILAWVRSVGSLAAWKNRVAGLRCYFPRWKAERAMASLSLIYPHSPVVAGPVLVDGMFDNPNYFMRYATVRAALGLQHMEQVGVLGPYRRAEVRRTFRRMGVREVMSAYDFGPQLPALTARARAILSRTKTPEDVLAWRLPFDFPANIVYDALLKEQRKACVDLADPALEHYLAECLGYIESAARLFDRHDFRLALVSHALGYRFAPLSWMAIQRKIPAILLFGQFGLSRFVKIREREDMYRLADRPTRDELTQLPPGVQRGLEARGADYLRKRFSGQTNDLGATFAFQRRNSRLNRKDLAADLGWNPDSPIIAVYSSNWFDYPHYFGMSNFRDFLDWISATVEKARSVSSVNWLLKGHPCDEWYGGVTLAEIVGDQYAHHVRMVPDDLSGDSVMECADALVTYHGTAAIEYAASGKPVLVSDRGWYHDAGFVVYPRTRDDYIRLLGTRWWDGVDTVAARSTALQFAGVYFGAPEWQGGYVLRDDSEQWSLYHYIESLVAHNRTEIGAEVDAIRKWMASDYLYFHTYKILHKDKEGSA